jgi:minor extracellular serine protease Vpr
MKKIIIIIAFVISAAGLYAQSNFSSKSKMLIKTNSEGSIKSILNRNEDDLKGSEKYVNALIKTDERFNHSMFEELQINVRSSAGNIYSVSIPISRLPMLAEKEGIKYLSVDSQIKTRLENATADIKTPLVHSGIDLPKEITGKNVIVGVIDVGFDYTHPSFHNEDSLRITRVWEQTAEDGTPPEGYNYGNELIGKQLILEAQKSPLAEFESHGTHVTGIAAGSGYLSNGKYTGAAPGAEIVLVEVGYGESNLIDAVAYIFHYAESVGKPAVINMSLGSHMGPHDGTSLLDQAFDQLQGTGKILAGAAGNEGDMEIHLLKTAEEDSVRSAYFMLGSGFYPGYDFGDLNIYGDEKTFSIRFTAIDTITKQIIAVSDLVSTADGGYSEIILKNGDDTIAVAEVASENGIRHNMYILSRVKQGNILAITLIGSGTVHAWNLSERPFTDLGLPNNYKKGDNNYTVGEVGGTGLNVITTGAYTTKNKFINLDGLEMDIPFFTEIGERAAFTSMGPTLDGRIKPDISAPGNAVASSVSRFDHSFMDPIYRQFAVDRIQVDEKEWLYAVFQGTSMSSPMTAGVIGLMLSANPSLTATDIKNIFKNTARTDQQTGTIPFSGNNLWGYGKIDAHAAVLAALNLTDVEDKNVSVSDFHLYNNYPNPFNPITNIKFSLPKESMITISIYNIIGEKVNDIIEEIKAAGTFTYNWDAKGFASGVYICRATVLPLDGTKGFSKSIKMSLLK